MSARRTHRGRGGHGPAERRAGGKDGAKGDARPPAAGDRQPQPGVPRGLRPGSPWAPVQRRAGHSDSAPCPPLRPENKGAAGKEGLPAGGAEWPAPEYGRDLPPRADGGSQSQASFLFSVSGLSLGPRIGGIPHPNRGRGARQLPGRPTILHARPPAASDWRIPSGWTPDGTLSPSPPGPAPHRVVPGEKKKKPVLHPVPLPSRRGPRPLPATSPRAPWGPRRESLRGAVRARPPPAASPGSARAPRKKFPVFPRKCPHPREVTGLGGLNPAALCPARLPPCPPSSALAGSPPGVLSSASQQTGRQRSW